MVGRAFASISVVLVVGGVLGACGAKQDEPQPEAQIELTSHPCDVLRSEAIEAAGIGGREPERHEDREEPFQRRTCSYISRDPFAAVSVSFNARPLEQVDSDERVTRVQDTWIAGHQTMVHDYPRGKLCVASVAIDPGILEVMVGYDISSMDTPEKACDFALEVARDLAPYFPDRL